MIILGLDISTNTVGLCLIEKTAEKTSLLKLGAVSLGKYKGLWVKISKFKPEFVDFVGSHAVDAIIVEEPVQSFRPGWSTAKTIGVLQRFNGIVCYVVKELLQKPVHFVLPMRARKVCGFKQNRKLSQKVKEQVFDWVQDHPFFVDFDWPSKVLASGPRKGQIILRNCCYDMADAFVVALYGTLSLNTAVLDDNIV